VRVPTREPSRVGILTFDCEDVERASGHWSEGRGLSSLSLALQELTIFDALYELHLDFGFLVRDIAAGFRGDD
jgi:hypothetical protein